MREHQPTEDSIAAGNSATSRSEPGPVIPSDVTHQFRDARSDILFQGTLAFSRGMPRGKERIVRWIQRLVSGNRPLRLRTHRGTWIVTDPSNLEVYVRLARVQDWDDHVLRCCLDLLHSDASFFDVGANAGYISLEVAAALEGRIDIAAFEPQPTLAYAAAGSAALNGFDRMRVFSILIGEPADIDRIYVSGSSLHTSKISRGKPRHTIEAASYSLDQLVRSGVCRPPDVIKIDVEGAELEVVNSSRDLLREVQPAIVFENDANMLRFNYSIETMLDALRECGYDDFFHVLEDGRYVPLAVGGVISRDLVAVPHRRMTSRFDASIVT